MEDSNRAIYFSIQIIILQNKLYKKYYPSRKELLKFSRDNLKNIYNNCIKIIHEITTYTVSASSTTKSNIDNYSLNLTTISSDLERNITITKYINVIEEFSFAIYSFMNLKDENVSFLDTSFNFILGNYETLLIDDLEDFSNIFLDEFILLKKQLIIIIIIIVVIYLIVFFISLFLQFKIMRKIFDEQERTTDIFFKINPDYIINAIKNCERFIEFNQKDKTNPDYLISNPFINFSTHEDVNDLNSSNDIETNKLLKKNIQIEFKIRRNFTIKKRKKKFCDINKNDKIYINYFILFMLFFIGIIIYIINIQIQSYKYVYILSDLYFLILNQRTFLIKYYNYFLTISCYYAHKNSNIRIKKIYNSLQNELKIAIKINQKMFDEIFTSLKKTKLKEKKILIN